MNSYLALVSVLLVQVITLNTSFYFKYIILFYIVLYLLFHLYTKMLDMGKIHPRSFASAVIQYLCQIIYPLVLLDIMMGGVSETVEIPKVHSGHLASLRRWYPELQ